MPNDPANADRIDALLVAVHELSEKVKGLAEHLSVSQDQANRTERQAQRTKGLTKLVAALAVISLVGVIATAILLAQVRDAVHTNESNAVTNCQNANQSRAATLSLWTFILDASEAQNRDEPRTPEQKELLEKLRVWIGQLFAARDCSDLSRKYEIPPPPQLSPAS